MTEAIPTQSDIEASLAIILASAKFTGGRQIAKLLSYCVEEELAGRGDGLKAYTIAVDALDKPDSYDPATDPAIRVIATRTRAALDAFYQTDAGKALPARIDIPKGTYRPTFVAQTQSATVAAAPNAPRRGRPRGMMAAAITVIVAGVGLAAWQVTRAPQPDQTVMPQVAFQVTEAQDSIVENAEFIRQRGLHALSRFGQLYVPKSQPDRLRLNEDQFSILVEVVVEPNEVKDEILFQVSDPHRNARLSSSYLPMVGDGRNIDFDQFDAEVSRVFSQNGPVFQYLRDSDAVSDDLRCILDALQNRATADAAYRVEQIACLKDVVAAHPNLGLGAVQLSAFLVDEHRANRDVDGQDPLKLARDVLDTTLERSPNLPGALMMMADIAFEQDDLETAFAFDRRVITVLPEAPMVRAWSGRRLVQAGHFDEGVAQLMTSLDLSVAPQTWQRSYYFLGLVGDGRIGDAAIDARYLTSATTGINGLAAYFVNIKDNDTARAEAALRGVVGDTADPVAALTALLLQEGFKSAVAEQIVEATTTTDVWRQVSAQ